MADGMKDLSRRVRNLEVSDDGRHQMIHTLEIENQTLNDTVRSLTTEIGRMKGLEALRKECVFSARLKSSGDLGEKDPAWKVINTTEMVYKKCRHFDENRGEFTAPIEGDYHMDIGARQQWKGGLEVMLHVILRDGTFHHAYIGRTNGAGETCHKTMVLSLKAGEKVYGVVRRTGGRNADINWCAFHGYMITAVGDLHVE